MMPHCHHRYPGGGSANAHRSAAGAAALLVDDRRYLRRAALQVIIDDPVIELACGCHLLVRDAQPYRYLLAIIGSALAKPAAQLLGGRRFYENRDGGRGD